jgi:anti-sigma B factor antagonist
MRHRVGGDDDLMATSTSRLGHTTVVSVTGEIDMSTGPRLRRELADVLDEPGGTMAVDLTRVTLLGSTGLAVLVDAYWQARQRRRPLVLVVDEQARAVRLALQTAGVAAMFPTFGSVAEAIGHPADTPAD